MVLFLKYIESLYDHIPKEVYFYLLASLCSSLIFSMVIIRHKKRWRVLGAFLLVLYIFFVFCSTVIFRDYVKIRKFDLIPFWSYVAIFDGQKDLLIENAMNIAVFVPIGILLKVTFKRLNWQGVFLVGMILSLVIETMQFIFIRGFAEVDDIIHNTLGCQIGYGIHASIALIMKKFHCCPQIITKRYLK